MHSILIQSSLGRLAVWYRESCLDGGYPQNLNYALTGKYNFQSNEHVDIELRKFLKIEATVKQL